MTAGPRTPDLPQVRQETRMKQGNPLAEQIPFLRTKNRVGAFVRMFGMGRGNEVRIGGEVKKTATELRDAQKAYDDFDFKKAPEPGKPTPDQLRQNLLDASRKLVDVNVASGVTISPEEQVYIDSLTIAEARKLEGSLTKDAGYGSSLKSAERYRQNQPHMLITRTPEGLTVVTARGEVSFTPTGELSIGGALPVLQDNKGEVDKTRESRATARVSEVKLIYGETTTAGTRKLDHMEHQEEVVDPVTNTKTVVTRTESLHSDTPAHLKTTEDAINSVVSSGQERTLYRHQADMTGTSFTPRDFTVFVVGEGRDVRMSAVREALGRYREAGGTPQPGAGGRPEVDLYVGERSADLYPNNPRGLHISGISDERQTFNLTTAQREANARTDLQNALTLRAELTRTDFTVPVADVNRMVTDAAVGLSVVNAGMSVEDARTLIRQATEAAQTRIAAIRPQDRQRQAYGVLVQELNRINAPAPGITESTTRVRERVADLIAGSMTNVAPSELDLLQRVRRLRPSEHYPMAQVLADARAILNVPSMDAGLRDLVIADVQNNTPENPNNRAHRALLRAMQAQPGFNPDMLSAEERALLATPEALPTAGAGIVARLIDEVPRQPGERNAAWRTRLIDAFTRQGFDPEDATLLVDRNLANRGVTRASTITEVAEFARQMRDGGGGDRAEFADVMRELTEALNITDTEKTNFANVLTMMLTVTPRDSRETPEEFKIRVDERLDQAGMTDAAGRTNERAAMESVLMRMNRMDQDSVDAREAEDILRRYGTDRDHPASPEDLPASERFNYLRLTRATPDVVMGVLLSYVQEVGNLGSDAITAATLESLSALARRPGYAGMNVIVNGLLARAYENEVARTDIVDTDGRPESPEAKLRRLQGAVYSLTRLSPDAGLTLSLPPAERSVDESVNSMSAEAKHALGARLLAEDPTLLDPYLNMARVVNNRGGGR